MRFRLVLAGVTASTIAACSLFSGLDGFTSPPDVPEGGATDAGSEGAIPAEGGDATEAGDSSSPTDAGADGARFCPTQTAILCEDFDDDNPLSEWQQVTPSGTSFALVTDQIRSAPRAVRAGVTLNSEERGGYIERSLSALNSTHARLSYSLFIEQRPNTGGIEVCGLRFNCGPDCSNDFYVEIKAGGAELAEQHIGGDAGYGSNYHSLGNAIPTGQWVRVSLEVVLVGARKMKLSVDGVQVLDKDVFLVGPGIPNVQAGITYANASTGPASIVVDDVVFENLP